MSIILYCERYNLKTKLWDFIGTKEIIDTGVCDFLKALNQIDTIDYKAKQPESNYMFDWYVVSGRTDLNPYTIAALQANDVQDCVSLDNYPEIYSIAMIAEILEHYQTMDYPRPQFYQFDVYDNLEIALNQYFGFNEHEQIRFIISL